MSCAAASGSAPSTSRSAETDSRPRNRLYGDMVDGEPEIVRDDHDPFAHRLVVEHARLGGDGEFGGGDIVADGTGEPLLDGGHTIERQRTADTDAQLDE